MRIPLSWLKEYILLSQAPSQIAQMLTMIGIEVDHFETIGEHLKDVVIGRVIASEKHPQADKLSVAKVTDGKEVYQIVCGASNCRAGIKVALARIGAMLKSNEQVLTIKKAKIRGVESEGMLCSWEELGLPEDGNGGIIEIPDHLSEGTSLVDIYADTYFDISLTPNLSHCTSIMGVARELAALTEQSLHLPHREIQESEEAIENSLHIRVIDKESCPRYTCRVIRNIQVGPSPDWLKQRLEKCGLRSINNVVDVTNYVLLEMGHPLHAFDFDKLDQGEIIVRKAKEGESIRTLDNKERALKESMLLICDSEKPAAIAGVMGGAESEIQEQTRNIVLESAYFDPLSIRRTSKQLGVQTDSSKRFERGTDPNFLLTVLNRAARLIQEVAGGEILSGVIDIRSKEFSELIISCRLQRIERILGINISRGEVENIFKRLQFSYQWDGKDQFVVHVPTYRVDIKSEIDLIEEVARFYGYDHIPRMGGYYQASNLPPLPIYLFENHVRTRLIAEGLQEFVTCDLIGPTLLEITQDQSTPVETLVKVLNPTSIEQSILRTSLLPGLLQVVKYNFDRQNKDIAGFEVGRIHFRDGEQYKEQPVVGIVLSGKRMLDHWDQKTESVDFFDLKGIVENFLTSLGIDDGMLKNLHLKTFHTGRQASVFIGSLEIGSFGEIHPAIQRRLDVPQRIFFGEFNLQDLLRIVKPLEKIQSLALYPSSDRDWTFTIKKDVSFETILQIIHKQDSKILEEVSLKDIYLHERLGQEYQNMTLHFVYRDLLKTIVQDAVEAEHLRLTEVVLRELHHSIKI